MPLQYMASPVPDRELKKGSAELMILALLEDRARHGYEIGQLIELRSRGAIRFSFGKDNSAEDVDYVVEVLARAVESLRKLSPLSQRSMALV